MRRKKEHRMLTLIHRILSWTDDLLFPTDVLCLCCDRVLEESERDGVCDGCRRALDALADRQEETERSREGEALPEGISFVHSAYPYEAEARRLVHRLKFESVRAAAVPLAEPRAYLPAGEEAIIVPVPTDRLRRRKRGFNQSTLIAEHIAKTLGMEMKTALSRTGHRAPQTGLPMEKRKSNLVGCMRADDCVRGKRVLLIDDVYTTGATACEAARALLAAGAISVGVLTACRAMHDEERGDPFSGL